MSPEALKSMVASLQKRLVEFRDAHQSESNSDLGEVIELSLTPDNHLLYKAKLDLNLSGAKDLWYRVHDLGKKLGVSIGGSVIKAGLEYVADLGKEVFTYFDVDLYEISITRQAAYQYSFASAVTKSLTTKEEPVKKSEDQVEEQSTEEITADEVETTEENADVAAEEQSDATETAEQSEEQEDTEEVEKSEEAADTDAETEATTESEESDAEKDVIQHGTGGVCRPACRFARSVIGLL